MNLIKLLTPQAHAAFTQGGDIVGPGSHQNISSATAGTSLETLISTLLGALTAIAGLGFLIYFVIGGINWITAGGDQQKHQKATKQLTDAAIGLIVVVVAYAIAGIVGTVLEVDILNPASLLGL